MARSQLDRTFAEIIAIRTAPFAILIAHLYALANASAAPLEYHAIPIGDQSYAPVAINNHGQALVNDHNNSLGDAILFANGTLTNLADLLGQRGASGKDLNDQGHVVLSHYLYTNGTFTDLKSPAFALNNLGQVTGHVIGPSQVAYRYQDGVLEPLGDWFGGGVNLPSDINSVGKIVGSATIPNHRQHAYLYDQGTVTDLHPYFGDEPNRNSVATGINDAGQIVGWFNPSDLSDSRGFLLNEGVMTELGTFGGPSSVALDINRQGLVVGWAEAANIDDGPLGFLYRDSQMLDLNSLLDAASKQWHVTMAFSINDSGWILADSFDESGNARALILVPVPEPSGGTIVYVGVLALAVYAGRSGFFLVARRVNAGPFVLPKRFPR